MVRERFITMTWGPNTRPYWLTRDYFPEVHTIDQGIFPSLTEFEKAFKEVNVFVLPIPADCIDGFTAAYWRRPEAYLNEGVRTHM